MNKLLVLATLLFGCSREPAHHITEMPYKINNRTYYPNTSYDYDEVGYASWYGDMFHGRKTASGKIFNKNCMTAAHRTLPLPSVVRVTNLENGKSIIVIVNDRGPFRYTSKRIIDLSQGAARKLGFKEKGLAKVRVKCLPQKSVIAARYYNKKPYTKSNSQSTIKKIANLFN